MTTLRTHVPRVEDIGGGHGNQGDKDRPSEIARAVEDDGGGEGEQFEGVLPDCLDGGEFAAVFWFNLLRASQDTVRQKGYQSRYRYTYLLNNDLHA